MENFTIASLKVAAARGKADRICYLLYPFAIPAEWIEHAVSEYGVSIAVITGMDWDNDLTPWPAKGEPPGSPDFRGEAGAFLSTLTQKVLPMTEQRLGITGTPERTLAGVSLSGLFTLWQWMLAGTFINIICLSGSFWYSGFANWITSRPVPAKTGKAYFLLGDKEAKSKVKAFQPVQTDTSEIVRYLRGKGIEATFELVAGDHYQDAIPRLDRAMRHMFPVYPKEMPQISRLSSF